MNWSGAGIALIFFPLCIGLFVTAWWVVGIHSSLVRLVIARNARDFERTRGSR
jgi:hypothetical protein